MERRKFLTVLGTAAIASPVISSFTASGVLGNKKFEDHRFPELGYDFDALKPIIDAQTMELHYTKYHQGYFNKFLAAAGGTELMNTPMEEIFAKISRHPASIRNNGGRLLQS
jgi:superoxide dismutase, Fe-Mn family